MSHDTEILVTGATGLVGERVVSELTARGVTVRAMSRRTTAAPPSVEQVVADLDDPRGWDDALHGVRSVFLYPRGRTTDFLEYARRQGVRRVVLLSSGTVSAMAEHPNAVADQHAAAEHAARNSGLAWFGIRPTSFSANTLAWAPSIRRDRTVRMAYPDARYPAVHEADIASVAVSCLLDEHSGADTGGAVYEVTGPELISRREQLAAIGESTGCRLRLEELEPDQELSQMLEGGTPEPLATTVIDRMARSVADPEPVTDVVRRLTGCAALSYTQWVLDHIDAFPHC